MAKKDSYFTVLRDAMDIDDLRSRRGWKDLTAMQRGNVVVVSDAINRPAPRMVDAIERLAHALHPAAFAPATTASANSDSEVEEACACAH